ncbi:hypothetical protein [Aquisalinus flavus]|uniref:Uncharacterized protein n=1 Tax=Aquisalinus flavus TaxID=1526572 RepID=A0A8J2V5I3_9PROT|nr:hypothetical protein [Aquisalinus flavus]MBD0426406.1 hypothetical protein [Aquisalinus flavus]GGD08202.1 hypothetical protein GCM10011342_16300 [Aquisalinus flavus]
MKLFGLALLAALVVGALIVLLVEIIWIAVMAVVIMVLAGAIFALWKGRISGGDE